MKLDFNELQVVSIYSVLAQIPAANNCTVEGFMTLQDVLRKFKLPASIRQSVQAKMARDPDPDLTPDFPIHEIDLEKDELKALRERLTAAIPQLVPMMAAHWFPQTLKQIDAALK